MEHTYKDIPVGEFAVSEKVTVKVQHLFTDGKPTGITIRKWVKSANYDGPTKDGLVIPYDTAQTLMDLLSQALTSRPTEDDSSQ